jgi:hypothetical protein
MPLLPYKRYELVSAKTPSELEAALRAVVGPRPFFGFGGGFQPFEGVPHLERAARRSRRLFPQSCSSPGSQPRVGARL